MRRLTGLVAVVAALAALAVPSHGISHSGGTPPWTWPEARQALIQTFGAAAVYCSPFGPSRYVDYNSHFGCYLRLSSGARYFLLFHGLNTTWLYTDARVLPARITALCRDGTTTYSSSRSAACASHWTVMVSFFPN